MRPLLEDLKVYQRALLFAEEVMSLMQSPKAGNGTIADQLRRAAISIPTNIAEGSGRWHADDRKQFFWVARGSTNECMPLIRLGARLGMISGSDYARLQSDLILISKMLTRLISTQK